MMRLTFFAALGCLIICAISSTTSNECVKDLTAIYKENRECGNVCSDSRPCRNTRAKCLCDGACGKVCIPNGLVCDPPAAITNGKIASSSKQHKFGAEITYDCDDGYELIGPEHRICQGDERWSGIDTFCTEKGVRCDPPPYVVSNAFADIEENQNDFFPNDVIEYKCLHGYSAIKASKAITSTKCSILSNKETHWTPEVKLTCIPKRCSQPETIEDGEYMGQDFTFGKEITYKCHPGFRMFGIDVLTCTADGTWSGYPPECEVLTCEEPNEPVDGKATYKATDYGATVWFDCKEGFWLNGAESAKCSTDGNWDEDTPTCKKIECGEPAVPDRGEIIRVTNTTWNGRVDYKCDPLTSTTGDMWAICTMDNKAPKWSLLPPVCLGDCDTYNLENARTSSVPEKGYGSQRIYGHVHHNQKVQMECNAGYVTQPGDLRTKQILECQDGAWSLHRKCVPAPCPCSKIPEAQLRSDSMRMIPTTPCNQKSTSGTTITLRCHEDYPVEKQKGSLKCELGEWKYGKGRCIQKPCGIKSDFSYEMVTATYKLQYSSRPQRLTEGSIIEHDTLLQFKCTEEGYELYVGNVLVQKATIDAKCDNGSITKTPTCKPGRCRCSKLDDDVLRRNGLVKGCKHNDQVNSGIKLSLECANGYSIPDGVMTVLCSNAKWAPVKASCKKMCSCRELRSSLQRRTHLFSECNGLVDSGLKFHVTCEDPDEQFRGTGEAVCNNGRWIKEDLHCYSNCILPDIQNAEFHNIKASREEKRKILQHGKNVSVTCEKGYTINWKRKDSESDIVSCVDGKLGPVPTCIQNAPHGSLESSTRIPATKPAAKNFGCSCEELRQRLSTRNLEPVCSDIAPEDSFIQLQCSKGTVHVGGTKEINCSEGRWGFTDMTCTKEQPVDSLHNKTPITEIKIFSEKDVRSHPTNDVSSNTESQHSVVKSTDDEVGKEIESGELSTSLGVLPTYVPDDSKYSTAEDCLTDLCTGSGEGFASTVNSTQRKKKNCKFSPHPTLTAFLNHKKLNVDNFTRISSGNFVTYRCREIGIYKFEGEVFRSCVNGAWAADEPKCTRLNSRSKTSAPVIDYELSDSTAIISEDGSLHVAEDQTIIFSCHWYFFNGYPSWDTNVTNQHFVTDWSQAKDKYQLQISSLNTGHSGVYTCKTPYHHNNSITLKVFSTKTEQEATADSREQHSVHKAKTENDNYFRGTLPTPLNYEHQTPTPDIKRIEPKRYCDFNVIIDGLVTIYKGHQMVQFMSLPDGAVLRFWCRNLYFYELKGSPTSVCDNGAWSHPRPSCEQLRSNNRNNAPPVTFNLYGTDRRPLITEEGEIVMSPVEDWLQVCCYTNSMPILTVQPDELPIGPSEQRLYASGIWSYNAWINLHGFKGEKITVSCSDNPQGINPEGHVPSSRILTVKVANVCRDTKLVRTPQRAHYFDIYYTEGDEVASICPSNYRPDQKVYGYRRCSGYGEWENGPETTCRELRQQ